MDINNTTSQVDFSDIHRMSHRIATEYSSGIHRIFSRIDHTLNHKKKKIQNIQESTHYIKYLSTTMK